MFCKEKKTFQVNLQMDFLVQSIHVMICLIPAKCRAIGNCCMQIYLEKIASPIITLPAKLSLLPTRTARLI